MPVGRPADNNKGALMGNYTKSIIPAIAAVIAWATVVIQSPSGAITAGEWLVLGAGLATALGVYVAPNTNG